ncbi:VCBS domain-containing protein [Shewanella xiamenensis]|uniref:VCBS domain-containing protein n=2 Tax=Shewanella xiamenensis TaxID=332186 RepID=UPI0035B8C56A
MSPKKPLTLSTAKRKSRISAKLAKKSEIAAKKLDKDVAKLKAKEFRESEVQNSATPDIVATQSWRLATHATTQLANTEQSTEQKANAQSTTADIDNRHSTTQTASTDPEKTLLEQQQQANAAETQTFPKFQDYGSSESTHLGQGPHFDDTQHPLVTLSQLPEIGDIKQQIEPTALTVSMARTTLTQSVRPPIISTEQHHTPLSIDEPVPHQSIKEDAPAASISGKLHAHGEAITSLQWTVAEHQGQFGRLDIDPITGEWHYQLDNNAPNTDALAEGEHQTEQFTVTVSGPNGEQVSTIIVIDVEGSNDLPQILGSHLASISAADALQTVMGQLRSVDPDHNDVITWAVLDGQGQYGQLSINPLTGQWQYQLNNHANATLALVSGQQVTETFTVTATDQSGHPVSQQVSIQVNGADDAAIIQGEMTGLVTEDTQAINGQLTVSGQLSIQDPDKDQAHFSADSLQGQFGYLTIDVNGHWIYNADNTQATIQSLRSGEHLTDTFIIHSADGTAQNITVTINGTDDKAEISGTTSASLTEDSDTYQGMLRANGNLTITDNDHGPYLFTATEQSGQFGTLTIDELGHWTYIADNSQTEIQALKTGESITDTLVVQTQDGTQQTISITIHGTDDHSVIRGTSVVRVFEDKRLSQGQLHTDGQLWISNPDTGRAGFAAEQRQGQFGVLSISSDGHWTYTADNNNPSIQALKHGEFVTETLFVKALDGTTQKIEILIKGADDKAIIGGTDTATLVEDQSVQHGQLQAHGTLTITDPDAGQAQFAALTDVTGSAGYGHFSIDATGNWTYTANNTLTAIQQLNTGEHLTDSLTISSADGTNHTLTVTITGSNDAPVVAHSLVTTTATEDTAFSFSIPAGTFADIDTGDTLILSTGSLPAWLHFDAATGTFSGTPTNGDVGTSQVTITATDGSGAQVSTIFVLNVGNTNDAPTLTPIATVNATEDGAQVTGQFTATDPDSGDTLTFSIAQPVDGLTVNTDGSWRFDPSHASYQHLAAGQILTLTIPVTVADAAGATSFQDLVIKLNGSNDGATIGGISTGSAKEDNAQITTGQLSVADVDDGETHFVAQTDTAGTYGHFSLSADGRWSYQLDNSKPEIQQLSERVMLHENFNVHSADGTTHTITVDIVGTNDAPVLTAQSQSVTEDGSLLTGQMVATDVDTGDSQTFSTTAQTAGFTLNADGSYSFNPSNAAYQHLAAGQTETLTIPVSVTDSAGATATQQLVITVSGSNDGAIISGTDASAVTEDTQLTTQGQLTVTDIDDQESAFTAQANTAGSYGCFTLATDGHWTYTLDNKNIAVQALGQNATLTDSLTVQSMDGTTHTVTVTINGHDDGAVIAGVDSGTVTEDSNVTTGKITTSGQLTISDPDSGQDHFTAQTHVAGSYGSFSLDADGQWHYSADNSQTAIQQLKAGETLTDSLTVQSVGGTPHTVTITITGSNDAPVLTAQSQSVAEDGTKLNGQMIATDVDTSDTLSFSLANAVDGFTLNADGSYSFDPSNAAYQHLAAGQTQTLTIPVSVTDSAGATATQQLVITVTGSNDGAIISGTDASTVTEDTQLTTQGQLTVTDIDDQESAFTAQANTAGSYGSFTLTADGHWTYTLDNKNSAVQALGQNATLTDSLTVQSVDGTTHAITVTINGHDDGALIAGVDSGTVTEDSNVATGKITTSGQLTISDPDAGQDHFTAQTNVAGSYGTFSLDADGQWRYSADNSQSAVQQLKAGETLTDSITVQSVGGTTHTVTTTITGSNDAPVLTAQSQSITEDGAKLTGQMVATDVDTGDTLTFSLANAVDSFTLNADGSYSFDPSNAAYQHLAAGQTETLTIPITVTDSTGATSTANLTITLAGTDDGALISGTDACAVTEDTQLTTGGQLAVTDIDDQESAFTAQAKTAGSYGSFTLAADGHWTYTLNNSLPAVQALGQNATLTDSLAVQSVDGTTHTITVTINGHDDGAVIAGVDSGTVTEDANLTAGQLETRGQLTISDPDAGQDHFTALPHVAGSYGMFSLDADGQWRYSADNSQSAVQQLKAGETLTDSITVQSVGGTTHTVTITLTGSNDAPVLTAQSQSITEDGSKLSGQMVATDVDIGDSQTFSTTAQTAGFTLNADGSYSFDPTDAAYQHLAAGQTQTLTIPVSVTDSAGATATQQLVITVTGSNDGAVISGTDAGAVTEDMQLTTGGQLTVTDIDDQESAFTAQANTAGSYGSFTLAADGHWTYTLDNKNSAVQALGQNATLTDSLTVQSVDGTTHTVTVTINGHDDGAVIAGVDRGTVTEDANLTADQLETHGKLTITDPDTGQDHFTAQTNVAGSYGTFSLDADGQWHYSADNSQTAIQQLKAGETLTDSLTVQSVGGTTHTVTVTITGSNDAPVLTTQSQSVSEDGSLLTGQMVATDVDTGDSQTFSTTAQTAGFTLNADGSYSFDPTDAAYQHLAAGQTETLSIPVSVTDSAGATATQQLVITVSGSNDGAIISGTDASAVTEDTQLTTSGQLAVTDIDDLESAFTAQANTAGSYGSFTLAADGQWTYTLDNKNSAVQALGQNATLTDSLTVQAVDGTTHKVTVTINGHDDGAVITGVDSGTVTEDSNVKISGLISFSSTLTVSDIDTGEARFPLQQGAGSLGLGNFLLAPTGGWGYSVDNNLPEIQQLKAGQTLVETYTFHSADGSQHTVTVTITGSNDAPVLTAQSQSITEDGTKLSGQMVATDMDTGDTLTFSLANAVDGFTLNADGRYSFDPTDAAYQHLAAGQTETLSIPITVTDSSGATSTANLTITLAGSNDGAIISGTDASAVTEDTQLTTQGQLTVTDIDDQESAFTAQANTAGSYGSFTLAADGNWTYTLDNKNSAVQALGQNATLTDSLTVQSVDGTTHTITVTINGHDDGAVIAGVDSGTVTEDANLTAGQLETRGQLTISDPDAGQDHFTAQTHVAGSYGMFSLDQAGHWTYVSDNSQTAIQQLKAGETLTDSLTVQSVGGTPHTVTITITGSNDAPVLTAQSQSVTEDGSLLTGQMVATDVDTGDSQIFSTTAQTAGFTLNADGSYSFDPTDAAYQHLAQGQTETLTIPITVTDSTGATSTANLTITLAGSNDGAIISGTDAGTVTEDTQLTTGGQLTVTDIDDQESAFTAQAKTAGSYGSFTLAADGHWTYTLDNKNSAVQALGQNATLTDSLTVQSVDGTTHAITVTINGHDDGALIAGVDSGTVTEDSNVATGKITTSGQLTISDPDAGQDHFTAQTNVAGSYGTFSLNADGQWRYSADNSQTAIQQLKAGATLTDSFTVTSADGTNHTVTVTLTGSNDAPVLTAQSQSVTEDGSRLSGQMVATDVDQGDTLHFSIGTRVAGFTLNADGSYSFDPSNAAYQYLAQGQTQTLTIPVSVTDSTGATSTANLTITLTGTNDGATLTDHGTPGQIKEDLHTAIEGHLSVRDVDSGEGLFPAQQGAGLSGYGSFVLTPQANGQAYWRYSVDNSKTEIQQLGEGQLLHDSFTVHSADGTTHTITVDIVGTNDAPVLTAQSQSVTEDGSLLSGQMVATDVDTGDTLTFSLANAVDGFTLNADGSYSFDPSNAAYQHLAAGQTQTLTIPVSVTDSTGATSTANLTITLTGSNDGAIISGTDASAVTEDTQLTTQGQLTVTDIDDQESAFTAQVKTAGSYGSFTLAADGHWTYTLDNSLPTVQALGQNATLTDSLTVQSVDGTTHTITVTINGHDDGAVIAGVDSGTVTEDANLTAGQLETHGQLTISDPDAGQDHFTAQTHVAGSYGTFSLDADGQWRYSADNSQTAIQQLKAGATLTDSFTVTSADGTNHTVTVTLTGSNDGAVISGTDAGTVTEDTQLTTQGQLTVTDIDDQESAFTAQVKTAGSYGSFTLAADGQWTYTLDNKNSAVQALGQNVTLTDSLTVQSVDGTTHTITVTINGHDDGAVIAGVDSGTVTEDANLMAGQLETHGQLTITDPDAGQNHFTSQTNVAGSYGTFSLDQAGHWTYVSDNSQTAIQQLKAGETLTDSLTVQSVGGTTHTITVTLTGTNDVPVLTAQRQSVSEDGSLLSGQMVATDVDTGDSQTFSTTAQTAGFTLNADGSYSFDPSNAAYQHLAQGQTLNLTIPITVTDSAGASSTQNLSLNLTGTNDGAVIGGDISAATTEDSTQATRGRLTITDVDDGEAHFVAQSNTAGTYGSFTLLDNGQWSYQLDNSKHEVQALKDGQQVTDTFTVTSADGGLHQVTVTITGKNDAAVITGEDHQTLTEDQNVSGGQLIAQGQLHASTPDAGGDQFTPLSDLAGKFGHLSLGADGHWVYKADNNSPAVQALGAGQSATESFTVHSVDGTAHTLSLSIQGADEIQHDLLSSIVSTLKSNVFLFKQIGNAIDAKDAGSLGNVVLSFYGGNPHVVDADGHVLASGSNRGMFGYDIGLGQVVDLLKSHPGARLVLDGPVGGSSAFYLHDSGDQGQLHFAGNARYNVHQNTLGSVPIDGLPTPLSAAGAVPDASDSLTISVTDIRVDHAGQLQTSGQLGISDADAGESHFNAQQEVAGTYGSFSIDASGHWVYSVDNGQSAVQNLQAGAQLTDSFLVTSADGTSHVVSVAVYGKNDAPVLFAQTQSVSEDGALLSGQMQASDADAGDTLSFHIDQPVAGLTLNADGSYSFAPSNAAYQHLAAGRTETLTIPVTVTDGAGASSTQNLTITLTGTNDGATITDHGTPGQIKEDQHTAIEGHLSVGDVDSGEGLFPAQQGAGLSGYGGFTLTPQANGQAYWRYSVDNSKTEIQQLGEGQLLHDSFTVHSADGTTHTISVDIVGTNDAPVLTAQSQSVTEDGSLLTGQMVATDVDTGDTLTFSLANSVDGFTLNADGSYSFEPIDAAYQHLAQGQTETLTIPVSVTDSAGTTSTQQLVITVSGSNDGAVISGIDAGSVTEDTQLTTAGQLTVTDIDDQEAAFTAQTKAAGSYGSFTLAADGHWTYTLDNTNPTVQALSQTGTLTDSLTVQSVDGTTHQLTVTINGHDDGAVIAGVDSGTVTEDANLTADQLETHGKLTITDPDTGQDHFTAQTNVAGSYGTFSLDADGQWHYSADNSQTAIQQLKAGETLTDSITVQSVGGTTHTVTITINGHDDGAVIAGVDSGTVTEDANLTAGQLETHGQLTISDPDAGQDHFTAQTNVAGSYGTLSLDADGQWRYSADNSQSAIQQLKAGETLTDSFTVTSADGTNHAVTVTLTGSNDAPVLTAQSQSVTEDGAKLTGQMVVTDVDTGDTLSFSLANGVDGFTLNTDGSYSFDPASAAYQHLAQGQTETLTIPITVTDSTGATSTANLTITLTGTNDGATISGVDTGRVIEDQNVDAQGLLHASGQLQIQDADAGQSNFVAQNGVATQYGHFSIDALGAWSYTVDNNKPEVQALKPGGTLGETGNMAQALGQALVQSTMEGFHAVGEALTQGQSGALAGVLDLTVQGAAIVLSGPSGTTPVVYAMDAQGRSTLGVDELLSWLHQGTGYEVHLQGSQSDVQFFVHDRGDMGVLHGLPLSGATMLTDPENAAVHLALAWQTPPLPGVLSEVVSVISAEGTTHQITLSIQGTAEDAVISGTDSGTVTEDQNLNAAHQLEARGQLQVTDADAGQAVFQPIQDLAGHYGHLSLDKNGAWVYQADNNSRAVQALVKGQTVSDSFVVHSFDGTAHTISVALQGADDAYLDVMAHVANSLFNQLDPWPAIGGAISSGNIANLSGLELSFTGGTPTVVAADGHVLESFTHQDSFGTHIPLGHLVELIKSHPGSQLILEGTPGASSSFYVNNSGNPQQLDYAGSAKYDVAIRTLGSVPNHSLLNPHGSAAVLAGADGGSVLVDGDAQLQTQGHLTVLDADGDQAHFTAQQDVKGQYGQFSIDAQGLWHYQADGHQSALLLLAAGKSLSENFTVTSADGTSHTVTVQLFGSSQRTAATISGVDSGTLTEDTAQAQVSGQLSVVDPDAGEAHFIALADAKGRHGHFSLDEQGAWQYRLDNTDPAVQALKAGETLTDTLMVHSADGSSHELHITVQGSNDAPVLQAQSQSVTEDGSVLRGQMVAQDVDHGDALNFSTSSTTAGFVLHDDGSYTFDPANTAYQHLAAGQTQKLTIPITVTDGEGASDTENLIITITGRNDVPKVSQVEVLTASREDAVFVLSKAQLLAHVSDVDGDNLSITNITSDHGSLVSHRDGSYTFTPAANYNGQVTFHYDLVDGHGGRVSQTATMMLSAAPDAAIISGQDSGSVTEDQHVLRGKLSTGGTLSVTDPDGAAESRLIPTGTTAGSLISGDKGLGQFEVGANGHWNFVANNADPRIQALGRHDALQDTITVHSVDGTAHTITVTINGTNDAPTLAAQSKSVAENGAQLSGRMVATDVDTGDTQAFSTTAKISGFTLHADGSYTFDPSDAAYQHLAQGQTQTLTIPVEVRDGSGATATNNLTIQITGTNDRPQITGVTTPHTVINIDGGASGGGFSIVDGVVHAGAHQRVWQASDYAALSHNAHGSNSVGDIFVFSDAATVHGADGGGSVGRDPKDYIVLDKPASAYRITSSANHVDSGTNYGNVQVTEIATGKSWGTANNIEDIIFGDGTSYSGKSSVQKTTSEVAMPNLNGVLTVVEGGPRLTGHIQASDVDSGDTRTFSTSAHVAGFTLNSDGSFSFNPADAAYHHLAQGHKLSLDIPVVATDKHGTSDQRVLHLEITGIDDSAVRSTRPAPPAPQAPSTDAEQHAGIVEDAHHQAGQSDLSNHAASTLPSSTDSTDESHDSVPVFTKVVTNEQGGTGSPLADYLHFADTSQHVDLGGAADGTAVSPLADYLGPYTFGELQLHAQTSSQSSDEANFETIDSVNLDVAEPATVATSAHDLDSASSGHLNVSSVNYDASLLMGSVDEQTAQTNPAQDKSVDTTLFEGGNFSAQATTSPIDHYLQMVGLMPNSIEQQPTAPIELATLNTPSSTFQDMDTDMLDMVTINHFENPLIEEHKTPHLDQYGFQGEHAQLEVNPNDDDLLHSALNDMHNQM